MQHVRRIYEDPCWRRARRYVLARDAYTCHSCGGPGNEVDHVVGLVEGGPPFSPSNLVAACKRCNASRAGALTSARRRRVLLGGRRTGTAQVGIPDTLGVAALYGAIREDASPRHTGVL